MYLIYLCPEPLLQPLLGLAKCLLRVEHVQVSQNTHHLGEAVDLQDVEELKCLHLKSKAGVHHKQHLVRGEAEEEEDSGEEGRGGGEGDSPGLPLLPHQSSCSCHCHTRSE